MDLIAAIQQYSGFLVIAVAFILLIVIVLQIFAQRKISKLTDRVNDFMNNTEGDKNIEQLLLEYIGEVRDVNDKYNMVISSINSIKDNMKFCVQKVGVVRYNPFEDVGGELCFALALLDKNNDGVVLNSIYSREGCYTYAKPLENGICEKYKLSSEEEEAIKKAINN